MSQPVGTPALWIGFTAFIVVVLVLDLGVFHRRAHTQSLKEAGLWSAAWVSLALAFNALIYFNNGDQRALEFLAGYLIELSLSVDNLFVFLVLFGFFKVAEERQHRVLFWGILGAMVFRAVFIAAGTALLAAFHWIMYVFGAILVYTAYKLLTSDEEDVNPTERPLYRFFYAAIARFVPLVHEQRGAAIFVREAGRLHGTPLLLVLIAVETTDIVFAVDSIPAIFAVTTDPFIVYTSNIFAILGLRSFYFLLSHVMQRFKYLKIGLAGVLAFVGVKMIVTYWGIHIPIAVSLLVIAGIITTSAIVSVLLTRRT